MTSDCKRKAAPQACLVLSDVICLLVSIAVSFLDLLKEVTLKIKQQTDIRAQINLSQSCQTLHSESNVLYPPADSWGLDTPLDRQLMFLAHCLELVAVTDAP